MLSDDSTSKQASVEDVDKYASSDIPLPVLPSQTPRVLTVHPLAALSSLKKNTLLLVFCIATFLDICNVSGAGMAVPKIAVDIGLGFSQLTWVSKEAAPKDG